MFWQESDAETQPQVPDDVVDVMFPLQQCKSLPVDHAHALATALIGVVPWLAEEPQAAIHTIHVAGSQNGWERPSHGSEQLLLPSRRTKLGIRIPRTRLNDLKTALEGQTLALAGSSFSLGQGKERPLSAEKTLFARYVVTGANEDEDLVSSPNCPRVSAARDQDSQGRVRKDPLAEYSRRPPADAQPDASRTQPGRRDRAPAARHR